MATDTKKLGLGILLLAVGTVVIFGSTTTLHSLTVDLLSGVAALAMAGGALLVGLSERGAGV